MTNKELKIDEFECIIEPGNRCKHVPCAVAVMAKMTLVLEQCIRRLPSMGTLMRDVLALSKAWNDRAALGFIHVDPVILLTQCANELTELVVEKV